MLKKLPTRPRFNFDPLVALAAIVFCASFATEALADWRKIYQNPYSGRAYRAICFVDESFGVIGGEASEGTYTTTDGGQTWNIAQLPGRPPGNITQIRMLSRSNGWLTVEGDSSMVSLFETFDGARTWVGKTLTGSATDLYFLPGRMIVASRLVTLSSSESTDGGNTFSRNNLKKVNGLDFVDNLNGIAVCYHNTPWYRTTNGGVTWFQPSPNDTVETWSVYAVKGTGIFYTAGENDYSVLKPMTYIPTSVRRTSDYGATWTKVSNLGVRTTGHIAGFGEMLYVQTDSTTTTVNPVNQRGLWRSTDKGRTWLFVGGPVNDQDTRFWVMGCRGNVVIAFDSKGGVWRTDDGGDGMFAPTTLPKISSISIDSLDACSPRDTTISIRNTGCDTVVIYTAATASAGTSILDLTGGPVNFPYVIPPGAQGGLRLRFQATSAGAFASRIIVELHRSGVVTFDTVDVSTFVKAYSPTVFVGKLAIDSVSLCSLVDTSLTIDNPGCLTMRIVSVQLKKGTAFTLLAPIANDSIASGGSKTITIRYTPTALGGESDSIIVIVEVLGVQRRIAIPVTGAGKPDNTYAVLSLGSQPIIDFGNITRCDEPAAIPFTIAKSGCTDMVVQPPVLLDSNHVVMLQKPSWLLTALPQTVQTLHLPTDTLRGAIGLLPQVLGVHKGFIRITYRIGANPPVTLEIPYRVGIIRGSRVLDVDETVRDYDTLLFCDTKDLVVPIRNTGCDTMTLTQEDLSGEAFSMLNPSKLPLIIPPGQSTNVTVRYVPVRAGQTQGVLRVAVDSQQIGDTVQYRTVPLLGYATPTDTISFSASANSVTVKPDDTTTVSIFPSHSASNKGLTSIDITLRYNGDVMTPWPATASTTIPGATISVSPEVRIGTHITYLPLRITGANLALDSTKPLASIRFHITLSDTNATLFRISDFSLNNKSGNFGKCILGAVTDSGTIGLEFVCGNDLLYRYMRSHGDFAFEDGIAYSSRKPSPNPSSGNINLPLKALRPVDVVVRVYDASGALVLRSVRHVSSSGDQDIPLSEPLPANGTYHYSIMTEDGGRGVVMGEFVVLR